ncbi:hypothetical protein [Pseudomonas phage D6]|nr:hypothetical protein [Pseudomonas phage D6]
MNEKISRIALEQMFFRCWEFTEGKQNYTDILRGMMELAEHTLPCTMRELRECHAWENWQRNYNDPQAWFPQRIADDSLLSAFTSLLLDNYTFGTDTDWNLEVKCVHRSVEKKLGTIQFNYTNLTTEGHKRIGHYRVVFPKDLIREIHRHLEYLRTGKNPYEVPCE